MEAILPLQAHEALPEHFVSVRLSLTKDTRRGGNWFLEYTMVDPRTTVLELMVPDSYLKSLTTSFEPVYPSVK